MNIKIVTIIIVTLITVSMLAVVIGCDRYGGLLSESEWENSTTGTTLPGGWISVGDGNKISTGSVAYISLNIDPVTDIPYVAYSDLSNDKKPMVIKYISNGWVNVKGDGVVNAGSAANHISMDVMNGEPYIVYSDENDADNGVIYQYNNSTTDWDNLNLINGSMIYNTIFVEDSNNIHIGCNKASSDQAHRAYFDGSWDHDLVESVYASEESKRIVAFNHCNNVAYIAFNKLLSNQAAIEYKGDSTSGWNTYSSQPFSLVRVDEISVGVDSGTDTVYVAFKNSTNGVCVTPNSGKTDWVNVDDTDFTTLGLSDLEIAVYNNTPYVAYSDLQVGDGYKKLTVKYYNGTDWVLLGDNTQFSEGQIAYTSLKIDSNGIMYIAYDDSVAGGLMVIKKQL